MKRWGGWQKANMGYFYSHLIKMESLIQKLDQLDLEDDHKIHLGHLIDSHIHHAILDLILSELSDADKIIFIEKLKENPEDPKIIEFLNGKIDRIEDKIQLATQQLKEELHKDIKEAKRHG